MVRPTTKPFYLIPSPELASGKIFRALSHLLRDTRVFSVGPSHVSSSCTKGSRVIRDEAIFYDRKFLDTRLYVIFRKFSKNSSYLFR